MTDHYDTSDIGCLEAIEALYAWLDGELDDASIAEVEHHLEHCQHCYSRSQMERALTNHIRSSEGESAPDALRARMKKLMEDF